MFLPIHDANQASAGFDFHELIEIHRCRQQQKWERMSRARGIKLEIEGDVLSEADLTRPANTGGLIELE